MCCRNRTCDSMLRCQPLSCCGRISWKSLWMQEPEKLRTQNPVKVCVQLYSQLDWRISLWTEGEKAGFKSLSRSADETVCCLWIKTRDSVRAAKSSETCEDPELRRENLVYQSMRFLKAWVFEALLIDHCVIPIQPETPVPYSALPLFYHF